MTTTIYDLGKALDYDPCPAIYILKNKINKKVYVGETMNLRQRVYSYHKSNINTPRPILRAINKYGLENFSFEYHYHPNLSKDELLELEEKLIQEHNSLMSENGYNVCSRGQNRYSAKQSLEARKRRSEIFKGRVFTEEWKQNISNATKGEKHYMYGKKASEETKKKMSESHKKRDIWNAGKPLPDYIKHKIMMNHKNRMEIVQYTKSGDFVAKYPSIREAARQTGIAHQNITSVCSNKYGSAGGYVWKKFIPPS